MKDIVCSKLSQHGSEAIGVDAAQFLKDFDDYLVRVRGLAPRTRPTYCFWVRRFLAQFCGSGAPDWSSLRGENLAAFVQQEASRLRRNGRAQPGNAIRAMLRYLIFVGAVRDGLQAAIPKVPRWKHADLPRFLATADIDRVVAGALDGTATGRRNHAILLLLARTGVRADEVVKLTLDDIDWQVGTLCIESRKTRSERRLPLAEDVGTALYRYLKFGRPPCSARTIFLRIARPFGPLLTSAAICRVARRALTRAGVLDAPATAHLFRHSAATEMVRGGASFKEVADVLGHVSIGTTAIYAKLDIANLARVALAWPESAP